MVQFRNHLQSLKRLGAGEPKVEELSRVLRQHFASDENAPQLGTAAGAVMVFTSMRNAVTDICVRLNGLQGANIKARCGGCSAVYRFVLTNIVFWGNLLGVT